MNRSDCPIASALDHVGDRWSLLIIRDLAFFGKKSYSELMASAEKIATNILSNRLASLEQSGIIDKQKDPNDGRRQQYCLTQAGKDLLPILIELILWSAKHKPENISVPTDLVNLAKQDKNMLLNQLQQGIEER